MNEILTPDVTFKTQACSVLFEAWLAWRGQRMLPKHSDIDPFRLRRALPHIGILEIRPGTAAVFRLAGTGLRDLVGFDPTGQDTVALAPERYRRQRAYRVRTPALRPCGYHGESRYTYSGGLTDLCESIGLPLESESPDMLGLTIFAIDSILGHRWQNEPTRLIDTTSTAFRFLDIGAGIPGSIDPPPDFA